jgi:hypothetical protein
MCVCIHFLNRGPVIVWAGLLVLVLCWYRRNFKPPVSGTGTVFGGIIRRLKGGRQQSVHYLTSLVQAGARKIYSAPMGMIAALPHVHFEFPSFRSRLGSSVSQMHGHQNNWLNVSRWCHCCSSCMWYQMFSRPASAESPDICSTAIDSANMIWLCPFA